MYFLIRYCRLLEDNSFRGRTADFVCLILYGGIAITLIAPFVNVPFMGSALTFMMVYIWGRRNEFIRMNLFGLFPFTAPYLPWVLLTFSFLLGGSTTVDLIGIAVGHIYYFLDDVYPEVARLRGWTVKYYLRAPRLLSDIDDLNETEISIAETINTPMLQERAINDEDLYTDNQNEVPTEAAESETASHSQQDIDDSAAAPSASSAASMYRLNESSPHGQETPAVEEIDQSSKKPENCDDANGTEGSLYKKAESTDNIKCDSILNNHERANETSSALETRYERDKRKEPMSLRERMLAAAEARRLEEENCSLRSHEELALPGDTDQLSQVADVCDVINSSGIRQRKGTEK